MKRTPPPEAIEAAKHNPGGWFYEIVGRHDAEGKVVPEAIAGAWQVDDRGRITGEFIANPRFDMRDLLGDPPGATDQQT